MGSKMRTAFDGCMAVFFQCLKPGQEEYSLLSFLKACLNTFVLTSTLFQIFNKSANNMLQQILRTKSQGLRLKVETHSCLLPAGMNSHAHGDSHQLRCGTLKPSLQQIMEQHLQVTHLSSASTFNF